MDECKFTLSKRLTDDGCRYCKPQEYIDRMGEWLDEERADIIDKDAEIERLNALVAMQAEALNEVRSNPHTFARFFFEKIDEALSATAETVSAWQSKRDNEIRAKALDDAANWFESPEIDSWEFAGELRYMASELRAK